MEGTKQCFSSETGWKICCFFLYYHLTPTVLNEMWKSLNSLLLTEMLYCL